jgi:hypothetical protein
LQTETITVTARLNRVQTRAVTIVIAQASAYPEPIPSQLQIDRSQPHQQGTRIAGHFNPQEFPPAVTLKHINAPGYNTDQCSHKGIQRPVLKSVPKDMPMHFHHQ